MKTTSRLGVALACVIPCCLVLAAGAARLPVLSSPRQADQPPDPFQDATVLVEAFVVEVDLSVLYDMDVNPLGKSPHAVSVDNILEFLQIRSKTNIKAGAKVAVVHRTGNSRTKDTQTTYRSRTRTVPSDKGPMEHVDYTAHDAGQSLTVAAQVLDGARALVAYDFSYSGISGEPKGDAPADTVSWSWSGNTTLQAGEPAIVGAVQNDKTAVFLVLTAHIVM